MTTRRTLFCLVVLITLSQFAVPIQGNWFRDLLDPHISYWNPVSSGSNSFQVESVGFSDLSGVIAAFGDFNADKYTDVFTVRKEPLQDILQIYVWSNGGSAGDQFQYLDVSKTIVSEAINNVIPSDFNYDGRLDVLIQGKYRGQLSATIWYGDGKSIYKNYTLPDVPSAKHLLLLDANMDMLVDLFGELESTKERVFWISQPDGTFQIQPLPSPDGVTLDPIAEPHSNAFIDLNGDCLSDLVIVSHSNTTGLKSIEIWLNSPTTRQFSLDRTMTLPLGAGQVSFGDLNHDGTMDLIFPVCDPPEDCSSTNAIYVAFNSQQKLCTSITGGGDDCLELDDICTAVSYSFPPLNGTSPRDDGLVIVPNAQFHGNILYYTYPENAKAPHTISVGDYNCDGFPDLLVALKRANSDFTYIQVFDSVECSESGGCASGENQSQWRTYQFAGESTNAISNVTDAYAACFFDTGEDGTLDVFVFSDTVISGGDSQRQISCLQNEIDHGNYFLKSLALNGQCFQWCSGSATFPDPKPIGVNFPGATFKYVWTDNNSDKRAAMGVQMFQTAYLALQTPYVYLGIGDVASYFQYIYVGFSAPHEDKYYKAWPDVLPNSQVVVIPNPPDTPYFWKIEIFLRPSGMTFWTLITCIVACTVLAGTAVAFKLRERKQDRKDQGTSIIL